MPYLRETLQKLNEAFAKSDTGYVIDMVTDDIVWTIVGDKKIRGKEAFIQEMKAMESGSKYELEIAQTITQEKTGAVNGIMRTTLPSGGNQAYYFCDIYIMDGNEDHSKIKEMTSYVIEVRE